MAEQTNSFTISRYVLLFAVAAFCIGIVAWTMISANRRAASAANAAAQPVLVGTPKYDTPCARKVVNTIAQQWAYMPDSVPQKYMEIASRYADAVISTRETGDCNGVAFTCRSGQVRRDCDPCALGAAMQVAQEQHVADTVAQECHM